MSDRLHEIIAQVAVIHKELLRNKKIENAQEVLEELNTYSKDIQTHYLNLLLQYYFQENDLNNFKTILLKGAKFDMRFEDISLAFSKIDSNKDNVIEFMSDSIVSLKDSIKKQFLDDMYEIYQNSENRVDLEESLEIIKRNRYVCAYCFKHKIYEEFFINKDLLESLKRDLAYLLK